MSKINKVIVVFLGIIILILILGASFGYYYIRLITSDSKTPVLDNIEVQIQGEESVTTKVIPKQAVALELTPEQEKALSELGIDPEKLNEPETQACIVEKIGEDRIKLLMNGEEKPGLMDMIKFKGCF